MEKFKQVIVAVVRLIGTALLVDVALLAAVGASCWLGDVCTTVIWSERMFWVGLALTLVAAPLVIGFLSSGRLHPKGLDTDGWAPLATKAKLAAEERQANMLRVGMWSLRIGLVGVFAIVMAVLIEVLSR